MRLAEPHGTALPQAELETLAKAIEELVEPDVGDRRRRRQDPRRTGRPPGAARSARAREDPGSLQRASAVRRHGRHVARSTTSGRQRRRAECFTAGRRHVLEHWEVTKKGDK